MPCLVVLRDSTAEQSCHSRRRSWREKRCTQLALAGFVFALAHRWSSSSYALLGALGTYQNVALETPEWKKRLLDTPAGLLWEEVGAPLLLRDLWKIQERRHLPRSFKSPWVSLTPATLTPASRRGQCHSGQSGCGTENPGSPVTKACYVTMGELVQHWTSASLW